MGIWSSAIILLPASKPGAITWRNTNWVASNSFRPKRQLEKLFRRETLRPMTTMRTAISSWSSQNPPKAKPPHPLAGTRLLVWAGNRVPTPGQRFCQLVPLTTTSCFLFQKPNARVSPGRRERLPAHAPLRTVRDSFPSHGSSLASPDLLRRQGGIQAKGNIVPFAWALRAFQRMRQTKQRRFWKYSVSIGS